MESFLNCLGSSYDFNFIGQNSSGNFEFNCQDYKVSLTLVKSSGFKLWKLLTVRGFCGKKEEGTYLGRAFLVAEKSKMKARFEPVTSGFASQRLPTRPPGYLKSTALKNDLKQKEYIL